MAKLIGVITLCAVATFVAHKLYTRAKNNVSCSSFCSSTIESASITKATTSPEPDSASELENARGASGYADATWNPRWATIWEPVNTVRRQQHRQDQQILRLRSTLRSHPYDRYRHFGLYGYCMRLQEKMSRMEQQMKSDLNTISHLTHELHAAYEMNARLQHL